MKENKSKKRKQKINKKEEVENKITEQASLQKGNGIKKEKKNREIGKNDGAELGKKE